MNNYISEIASICRLPFDDISKTYKILWFGNKSVYVSNYKKVLDYNQSKIVLKVHKNILEIEGDELQISMLNKGEVVVSGIVHLVKLGENNDKKR